MAWIVTILSLIATQCAVSLVLYFLYRSNPRLRAAAWWAAGIGLVALAWLVNLSREFVSPWVAVLGSNALFYLAGYATSVGCYEYYGRVAPHRSMLGLSVASLLATAWFFTLQVSLSARMMLFAVTMLLLVGTGFRVMARHFVARPANIGALCSLGATMAGLLAYLLMAQSVPSQEANYFDSPNLVVLYIVQPAGAIGFGLFGLLLLVMRVNEELEEASRRDFLTGALNRRGFMALGELELARVRRFGGELGLAILDIDHFKQINDRYGHQAGDAVLVQFAEVVRREIRSIDVLCRYGGEEFILLLPGTPGERIAALTQRVRERLSREPLTFGGEPIDVSFSSGVVGLGSADADLASLIERADVRLYRAKARGRNRDEWEDDGVAASALAAAADA